MSDAEIIELRERANVPPIEHKGFRRHCTHHYLVDEDERAITCTRCGKIMDPFEVVADIARDWKRLWYDVKHAKDDLKSLRQTLEATKHEERKAKARLRRARKQLHGIEEKRGAEVQEDSKEHGNA